MVSSGFDGAMTNQYTNININFNFNGAEGVTQAGDILTDLISLFSPQTDASIDVFGNSNFHGITRGGCYQPAPVEEPVIADNGGGLQVDGSKVTTAGGYTIEQLGQYDWKITGPDGKETKIWGDPHVYEGDGGKWDFNANSTFVLGDGTKINVTTVPYGDGANGATVTGKLEIISGNDRVEVTDIDKGKGKIGTVTQDGYAHANSFQGQVFVQGRETDDWSMKGREIIGNESGKDNFKVGGELEAGRPGQTTRGFDQMFDRFANNRNWMMRALINFFSDAFAPLNRLGANPYAGNTRPNWEDRQDYDLNEHRSNLTNSFRDVSQMFSVLERLSSMNDRLLAARQRTDIYA